MTNSNQGDQGQLKRIKIDPDLTNIAREVLRLGERLFDETIAALEAGQQPAAEGHADSVLADDLRQAADEFLETVRLLLGLEDKE